MDAPQSVHVLLNCPECNRPMQVPQAGLGKRVRCPCCAATFVAKETEPVIDEAIVAEDVAPPQPASPPPSSPRRPRERQPDVTWDEEESRPYRRAHDDSVPDSEPRSRSMYWILGGVFSTLLVAGVIVLVAVLSNRKEPAAQVPLPVANNPRDPFKAPPVPQDKPMLDKDGGDAPDKGQP